MIAGVQNNGPRQLNPLTTVSGGRQVTSLTAWTDPPVEHCRLLEAKPPLAARGHSTSQLEIL